VGKADGLHQILPRPALGYGTPFAHPALQLVPKPTLTATTLTLVVVAVDLWNVRRHAQPATVYIVLLAVQGMAPLAGATLTCAGALAVQHQEPVRRYGITMQVDILVVPESSGCNAVWLPPSSSYK